MIIPSFHWFDSQVLTTGREFGNGACKINQEILHNQKDCRVVPKLIIIYVPNLLHLRNMNKELPGAFVNLGRPSICRVYIYIYLTNENQCILEMDLQKATKYI